MKRGLLSCWLRNAMESRYPRDTSVVANRERHHIARIEGFITHRASNPPMTMERSFRITLETPDGLRSFDCGEDEHIWDAAASHQITLPAALMTGRRQCDLVASSRVPDVLIFAAIKRTETIGCFQSNPKAPLHCHGRVRCSMGYKTLDSCYMVPLPVRHDGSVPRVSTFHRVPEPATQ